MLVAHNVSEAITADDPLVGLEVVAVRFKGKVIGGREGDRTDLGCCFTTTLSFFTT